MSVVAWLVTTVSGTLLIRRFETPAQVTCEQLCKRVKMLLDNDKPFDLFHDSHMIDSTSKELVIVSSGTLQVLKYVRRWS